VSNKTNVLIISLITLLIFSGVCLGSSQDEIQTKIDLTKKKLTETKRKEDSTLKNLFRTEQELEKTNSNITRLNSQLNTAEKQITGSKGELQKVQTEMEELKTERGKIQNIVNERVVALYKYSYQSQLQILFTAHNFSEFISRFEMVGRYVEKDARVLDDFKLQQNRINKKEDALEKKQQALAEQKNLYARLHQRASQEQSRQFTMIQAKQKELAILQTDRRGLEESLDELERISKEMETQIREYQNNNHVALGSGIYVWPISGRITSYFGNRYHPILKKNKYHSGLDIAAPQGDTILATDSGVVIFSGLNGGYGKMISIDHGAGFSSVYAHSSLLLVDKGQTVTKGQAIAKVGSTGLSTGPHLHFEIRKNGTPVNPMKYLKNG
jgi:murein DD-endopeptidase MepM/ murein hydrolase activator NlpD